MKDAERARGHERRSLEFAVDFLIGNRKGAFTECLGHIVPKEGAIFAGQADRGIFVKFGDTQTAVADNRQGFLEHIAQRRMNEQAGHDIPGGDEKEGARNGGASPNGAGGGIDVAADEGIFCAQFAEISRVIFIEKRFRISQPFSGRCSALNVEINIQIVGDPQEPFESIGVYVLVGRDRADLGVQSSGQAVSNRLHRPIESAFLLPEGVVFFGDAAVDAYVYFINAELRQVLRAFQVEQPAIGGNGNKKPVRADRADQFIQIRPDQRFSSNEIDDKNPHFIGFTHDFLNVRNSQPLMGVLLLEEIGGAMPAVEIAVKIIPKIDQTNGPSIGILLPFQIRHEFFIDTGFLSVQTFSAFQNFIG